MKNYFGALILLVLVVMVSQADALVGLSRGRSFNPRPPPQARSFGSNFPRVNQFAQDLRTGYRISQGLNKPVGNFFTSTAPKAAAAAHGMGMISKATPKLVGQIGTLGKIANTASNVGGAVTYATLKAVKPSLFQGRR